MTKKSNIVKTKDGLVEKLSGRKIESPLDTLSGSEHSVGVQPKVIFTTVEHSQKIINILNKHGYKVTKVTAHYRTLVDIRVECPSNRPE